MCLEKVSAKMHKHELYVLALERYKKGLEDFIFSEKLSKKDGKKILCEIRAIEKEIKIKTKTITDWLRLEVKKIN